MARSDERFVRPVIIGDANPDMRLASEETFGPLAPLFRFTSERQAIEMANATPYGLAAYFYTRDLSRAFRMAEPTAAATPEPESESEEEEPSESEEPPAKPKKPAAAASKPASSKKALESSEDEDDVVETPVVKKPAAAASKAAAAKKK